MPPTPLYEEQYDMISKIAPVSFMTTQQHRCGEECTCEFVKDKMHKIDTFQDAINVIQKDPGDSKREHNQEEHRNIHNVLSYFTNRIFDTNTGDNDVNGEFFKQIDPPLFDLDKNVAYYISDIKDDDNYNIGTDSDGDTINLSGLNIKNDLETIAKQVLNPTELNNNIFNREVSVEMINKLSKYCQSTDERVIKITQAILNEYHRKFREQIVDKGIPLQDLLEANEGKSVFVNPRDSTKTVPAGGPTVGPTGPPPGGPTGTDPNTVLDEAEEKELRKNAEELKKEINTYYHDADGDEDDQRSEKGILYTIRIWITNLLGKKEPLTEGDESEFYKNDSKARKIFLDIQKRNTCKLKKELDDKNNESSLLDEKLEYLKKKLNNKSITVHENKKLNKQIEDLEEKIADLKKEKKLINTKLDYSTANNFDLKKKLNKTTNIIEQERIARDYDQGNLVTKYFATSRNTDFPIDDGTKTFTLVPYVIKNKSCLPIKENNFNASRVNIYTVSKVFKDENPNTYFAEIFLKRYTLDNIKYLMDKIPNGRNNISSISVGKMSQTLNAKSVGKLNRTELIQYFTLYDTREQLGKDDTIKARPDVAELVANFLNNLCSFQETDTKNQIKECENKIKMLNRHDNITEIKYKDDNKRLMEYKEYLFTEAYTTFNTFITKSTMYSGYLLEMLNNEDAPFTKVYNNIINFNNNKTDINTKYMILGQLPKKLTDNINLIGKVVDNDGHFKQYKGSGTFEKLGSFAINGGNTEKKNYTHNYVNKITDITSIMVPNNKVNSRSMSSQLEKIFSYCDNITKTKTKHKRSSSLSSSLSFS